MTTRNPEAFDGSQKEVEALAIGLAFVAGYVDTVGFVALFGLFTAHVTGNFVLIGAALAQSTGNVLLKLLVFPAFVLAVGITRFVVVWMDQRGQQALRPLLFGQLLLLIGFGCFGWAASPVIHSNAPLVLWTGVLGGAAMGVQNAAVRLVLSSVAPTTVMTGNVTQLVIDCVDLALGVGNSKVRRRAIKFFWSIAAFAIGAVAGGFGTIAINFASLIIPVTVIAWLAISQTRSDLQTQMS